MSFHRSCCCGDDTFCACGTNVYNVTVQWRRLNVNNGSVNCGPFILSTVIEQQPTGLAETCFWDNRADFGLSVGEVPPGCSLRCLPRACLNGSVYLEMSTNIVTGVETFGLYSTTTTQGPGCDDPANRFYQGTTYGPFPVDANGCPLPINLGIQPAGSGITINCQSGIPGASITNRLQITSLSVTPV